MHTIHSPTLLLAKFETDYPDDAELAQQIVADHSAAKIANAGIKPYLTAYIWTFLPAGLFLVIALQMKYLPGAAVGYAALIGSTIAFQIGTTRDARRRVLAAVPDLDHDFPTWSWKSRKFMKWQKRKTVMALEEAFRGSTQRCTTAEQNLKMHMDVTTFAIQIEGIPLWTIAPILTLAIAYLTREIIKLPETEQVAVGIAFASLLFFIPLFVKMVKVGDLRTKRERLRDTFYLVGRVKSHLASRALTS